MQGNPINVLTSGAAMSPPANLRNSETTDPHKVARDFEALLVQNLLRTMRESGMGEMSNEESVYYDMFDEKIAAEIAESGRLGLADQIARSLPGGEPTSSHTVRQDDRLVFAEQLWRSRQSPMVNKTNPVNARVDDSGWRGDSAQRQQQFLDAIAPLAHSEGARGGIDPLPIMAIAALETGWGERMIKTASGLTSNNFFGIKQHAATGPAVSHTTSEYDGDKMMTRQATFRRYESMSASVSDFIDFLHSNARYQSALAVGQDPERFVRELHDAGYATDPAYTQKVLGVMDQIRRIRDS